MNVCLLCDVFPPLSEEKSDKQFVLVSLLPMSLGPGVSHSYGIRLSYICLPFKVPFREKLDSYQWAVIQRRRSPNSEFWVYFEQIIVKSTQFLQNWLLLYQKWYTDG